MSTTQSKPRKRWIGMIGELLVKEKAAMRVIRSIGTDELSAVEAASDYKRCQMLRRRFDNGERSDKLRRAMASECER